MLVMEMSNKKQEIPAIRFKGFTDTWEQRKLGELIENQTILLQSDGNHGELYPKSTEFSETGIPYLSAANIDLNTSTIDFTASKYLPINKAKIFKKGIAKDGDILLAHNATVGPTVMLSTHYPFVVLSTTLTLFRINQSKMNPIFFLYTLRSVQFQQALKKMMKQTTRNQVPILTQRNIDVSYPNNIDEQANLGIFFKQLDGTIALHQRQLDNFKELKKAMLQKMFPQNGEKVPEVRFEGFTEGWEQRKLGEWIVPYAEKTNRNNQYPVLTSSRRGIFLQTDYYNGNQVASEDNTGYNIVPRGYFTYRHMSDDEIFKFNINDIVDYGIVSTLYPVFTTKQGLDSDFLQYQLNNGGEFRSYATLQKQGGSRTYMYLSKLENLKLTIPELQEQIKISNFFNQLDQSINLHQQKVNDYQQIKKAMLQKMFV